MRGEFRPDGVEREWCDVEVLRQLRRRSLAALRREVEPVEQEALARFLPAWHGIPAQRRGLDALVETLGLLQGAPLVASTLERDVLPARVLGYRAATSTTCARAATSCGWAPVPSELVRRPGPPVLPRPARRLIGGPGPAERRSPSGRTGWCTRPSGSTSARHGASFWNQLRGAAPAATDTELLAALWDLVWAGEVTNDSLAPLRAVPVRRPRGGRAGWCSGRGPFGDEAPRAPRPGRLSTIGPPAGAGRWSLVAPLLEPRPTSTEAAHATALQLLERHGVLTREAVLAEGVPGGFTSVYGVLKVLEERGQVRRGYFVTGLGAAQFALPGAVDRLRSRAGRPGRADDPAGLDGGRTAEDGDPPLVLAATDPAQPYGAALAWPDVGRASGPGRGRPPRPAGRTPARLAGSPRAPPGPLPDGDRRHQLDRCAGVAWSRTGASVRSRCARWTASPSPTPGRGLRRSDGWGSPTAIAASCCGAARYRQVSAGTRYIRARAA